MAKANAEKIDLTPAMGGNFVKGVDLNSTYGINLIECVSILE